MAVGEGTSLRRVTLTLAVVLLTALMLAPNAQAADLCDSLVPGAIVGTADDDVLRGTPQRDFIYAGAGDDLIEGGGGNDVICGGRGADTLRGSDGGDLLLGGRGPDHLFAAAGEDSLEGGRGNDVMHGGTGRDSVAGGGDDDTAYGEIGADTFHPGPGDDFDVGGESGRFGNSWEYENQLSAPPSASLVINVVAGTVIGWGNDSFSDINAFGLIAWGGPVTFLGSPANDRFTIVYATTIVTASGGAGNDTLYGAAPLFGGTQGVTIDGGPGNDHVSGNDGNDTLTGGTGDDTLSGRAGDDSLDGGAGSDSLDGGAGDDTCRNGETVTLCEH